MEDDGMMRYPFCSTITYLTNHISPTIITNTMTGGYVKELLNFPPTEVVFSSPEEGTKVNFSTYSFSVISLFNFTFIKTPPAKPTFFIPVD